MLELGQQELIKKSKILEAFNSSGNDEMIALRKLIENVESRLQDTELS